MTGKQRWVICKKETELQCQSQPAMRWALREAAETSQVPLKLFPFLQVKCLYCQSSSGDKLPQVTMYHEVPTIELENGSLEAELRCPAGCTRSPLAEGGKANTLLSATKQGFLFGFHFDNGNLEGSWER